jgi:hypothetical protein
MMHILLWEGATTTSHPYNGEALTVVYSIAISVVFLVVNLNLQKSLLLQMSHFMVVFVHFLLSCHNNCTVQDYII